MHKPISHYCQKCLAANPLGQDFCMRCGTRLMIVVEPSSVRFEAADQAVSTDEHLLERISIVENRITRLTERLERSLDLLLRQAQNSYFDRSLVKTLISLLTEDGLVETQRLERLWNDRCQQDAIDQKENSKREQLRLKILSAPPKRNPQAFVTLVGEGFLALEEQHIAVGIDKLQRAAEMTESNSALNLFIGEHFFRSGETHIARAYLSKVHKLAPENARVSLLLGLTCADDGDLEKAKTLLGEAIERGGSCFAGHYGLGWLHLVENKTRKALSEFKRALEVSPSPEANFVLASLYYKLDRDSQAIRHLHRAIELDGQYEEAHRLLALIYERNGKHELANDALARASAARPSGRKKRQSQSYANRKTEPLFDNRLHGLMTGAHKRLATALREDALRVFAKIETTDQ